VKGIPIELSKSETKHKAGFLQQYLRKQRKH